MLQRIAAKVKQWWWADLGDPGLSPTVQAKRTRRVRQMVLRMIHAVLTRQRARGDLPPMTDAQFALYVTEFIQAEFPHLDGISLPAEDEGEG